MKRIYYPYNDWEEVKFGMYKAVTGEVPRKRLLKKAIELLSNPEKLKAYMAQTVTFWPCSTERNLTTPGLNKQAWLGQAACCLYGNVPDDITKEAWSTLNDEQKALANDAADQVYQKWETDYAKNL